MNFKISLYNDISFIEISIGILRIRTQKYFKPHMKFAQLLRSATHVLKML